MVIGNGLMASAFMEDYQDDNRYVIFASGVSNSSETEDYLFKKEEVLLKKTLKENENKHIVYFTSFQYSGNLRYANHKYYMEIIIRDAGMDYTILKLPQVIGRGGNANNLFNYLVNGIRNNNVINVYKNAFRSLIDIDDVKKIVDISVKLHDKYIIFPYIEKLLVNDIVILISEALDIKPRINIVDSDEFDYPERTLIAEYILQQMVITSEGYTERIINKYLA